MKPVLPKNIRKGMILFDAAGNELEVIDWYDREGVVTWSTYHSHVEGARKSKYVEYVYDYHDYGEGLDPLPLLYKKNPTKEKKMNNTVVSDYVQMRINKLKRAGESGEQVLKEALIALEEKRKNG